MLKICNKSVIKKKLACYIVAFVITISSILSINVNSYALEYFGTISALEAFGYLSASFGLYDNDFAKSSVLSDEEILSAYNNTYGRAFDKFKNFALATYGIVNSSVDNFFNTVANGVIKQADPVWNAYKNYLQQQKELFSEPSDSGYYSVASLGTLTSSNFNDISSLPIPMYFYNGSVSGLSTNRIKTTITSSAIFTIYTAPPSYYVASFISDKPFTVTRTSNLGNSEINSKSYVLSDDNTYYYYGFTFNSIDNISNYNYGNKNKNISAMDLLTLYYLGGLTIPQTGSGEYGVIDNLGWKDLNIADIGLINKDDVIKGQAIDGYENRDVVLDWNNVIDALDSIPDAIAKAIEGSITLPYDDTIAGAIPIDIPTDKVIDKEGVTDKTIEDSQEKVDDTTIDDSITSENTKVEDYTLIGLGNVFPFCIPFDFVNLVKAFNAQPVAPKFSWNVPSVHTGHVTNNEVEIDLSPFNSVASVFRACMLVTFVIALLFATRKLIFA